MSDGSTHETSPHGKQLVFLFMSVVVLAVVVFLCGVMVGRGVRDFQPGTEIAGDIDPTLTDVADGPFTPVLPVDGEPERLQYPDDLTAAVLPPDPPLEPLGESDPIGAADPVSAASVAPARPDVRAARADVVPLAEFSEPAGGGFVVQVHAARREEEALGIARRLAAKGYAAFVTRSGAGPAPMFRVRVGKFPDRREAKSVSDRLEAEEHFKPWITR